MEQDRHRSYQWPHETSASWRGTGQAGDRETHHLPGLPSSHASTVTKPHEYHISHGSITASSLCLAPETPACEVFCLGCYNGCHLSSLSHLPPPGSPTTQCDHVSPTANFSVPQLAQIHSTILLLTFGDSPLPTVLLSSTPRTLAHLFVWCCPWSLFPALWFPHSALVLLILQNSVHITHSGTETTKLHTACSRLNEWLPPLHLVTPSFLFCLPRGTVSSPSLQPGVNSSLHLQHW